MEGLLFFLFIIAVNVVPRLLQSQNSSEKKQGSGATTQKAKSSLKSLVESLLEEAEGAISKAPSRPAEVVKPKRLIETVSEKEISTQQFVYESTLEQQIDIAEKAQELTPYYEKKEKTEKGATSTYFKDKESLKRAFIMKEILDTPVSMR